MKYAISIVAIVFAMLFSQKTNAQDRTYYQTVSELIIKHLDGSRESLTYSTPWSLTQEKHLFRVVVVGEKKVLINHANNDTIMRNIKGYGFPTGRVHIKNSATVPN